MNELEQDTSEQVSASRLLIPTLIIGAMSVNVSYGILQLFMVDVASTFHVSVGVASQLAAANYAGEFISALLIGALVVRFRYKPLILAGMLLVMFSAIGSFLAPDFATMQILLVLEGLGTGMFIPMSRTIIGDTFTPQRRSKAVSYLMAASFGTALISLPWSGFVANIAGWRSNFVLQMLPITLAGIALALLIVPSRLRRQSSAVEQSSVVKSFKHVLKDKSATACLVSQILAAAATAFPMFATAFYRERFSVSIDFTVVIGMASLVLVIVGSLVAGRLASRFGARPTAIVPTLLCGVFVTMFFFIPNLLGAMTCHFLFSWFGPMGLTGYVCLAVAQVPETRGTMMSLNSAVESAGSTIGPALGGAILVLTLGFYGAVGLAFGGLYVICAMLRLFFTKEPDRK
jgi:DHA1 family multidrug resistance protein-like MFS transporter